MPACRHGPTSATPPHEHSFLLDRNDSDWRRLDDDFRVIRWRTERLLALGYPLSKAADLAHSTIDPHELERLIHKGCPAETAVRIAA